MCARCRVQVLLCSRGQPYCSRACARATREELRREAARRYQRGRAGRMAHAARFNPELLKFAAHYRYEPRPVAVARGNEKGRDSIRTDQLLRSPRVRRAGRPQRPGARLVRRLGGRSAMARGRRPLSVREAFERERASLMALPERDYPLGERVAVDVGKTPYVRFDWNEYSTTPSRTRMCAAH